MVEVLHLFRCSTHTHTPPSGVTNWGPGRWSENEDEREMKMRWKWRWGESYLTGTQDGERKKRRGGTKREHQHQHTWPGAGGPWKGKGKEKAEADGNKPGPEKGGEDGSAWTNLLQRKQSLPKHARTKTYLERGSTHEIGDQWGPSWWQTKPKNNGIQFLWMQSSCVVPITGPWSINPNWALDGFQVFTNLAHNWFTSPR